MNIAMIIYILGHIMRIEAGFMAFPCIVALIYREPVGFTYLIVAGVAALIGTVFSFKRPENTVMYLKEGCLATAMGWIVMSIIGALPFYITGEIPSFTNALFETVSGFTTTGASILESVEVLTHTALFWRSLTHWIGGMGVLVFLLAIVTMSGGSTINLMKAESPGPSVGKLVPKIKSSARMLYIIYSCLTIAQIIFMLLGRCPLFDAITLSLGTAGTGGFGIKNDSMASYSPYIQWVVTIFMIIFGVNFNAYYFFIIGKIKEAFHVEEVKYYLLIILTAGIIIFANIKNIFATTEEALRHSFFQVASIITTSGFATQDFDTWNTTCKVVILLLMFTGACAGSTGGGIKVSRFVVIIKTIANELNSYIHPNSVKKVMFEGKPADLTMVKSINVFMITYTMIFVASLLMISINGEDLVTSITAVATAINNVGPGLNNVGPTRNFNFLTDLSKFVLIFDMLAGRLELFPVLMLLHPVNIKEMVQSTVKSLKKPTKRV